MDKRKRSLWETRVTSIVIFFLTLLAWSTFGRPRSIETVDTDIVRAAHNFVEENNKNDFATKIVEVKEAEMESSNGDIYSFTIRLQPTKCSRKSREPDFDVGQCQDNFEHPREECRVRVLVNPSSSSQSKPKVELIGCNKVNKDNKL